MLYVISHAIFSYAKLINYFNHSLCVFFLINYAGILKSKCLILRGNRTVGSILSPTSLYFYEGFTQTHRTAVFHFVQNVFLKGGFTQTLTTKCFAFRWVFICVRVCEQAHTASINKNPVTFVTGFVPRTGIEPALPCDNQILSLARLPVPPSGPLY